jgi:hypothetical protein
MSSSADAIVQAIREAFPVAGPPDPDALFRANLTLYRPFEAEELRHELAGKAWTDIDESFVDSQADWLAFLSPQAFRYYLPAWLVYGADYRAAGYAADFTAAYLAGPDPGRNMPRHQSEHLTALDDVQRGVVIRWLTYLVDSYPDEDPGWLRQKGLTVDDIRADLESLG